MGAYSGPELVDDGLVLALDAANTRSYGGSGTTWTDVSYRGNNGTLTNGPVFTQEPSLEPFGGAGAVSFDGTGDYLSVPDSSQFTLGSGDFTLECWAYFTSSASLAIFLGHNTGNPSSSSIDFRYQSGTLTAYAFYGGANLNISGSVSTYTWTHIAFVRDSSTLRLFINGSQAGTANIGSNSINDSSALFEIGRVAGYPMQGYLSNVRFVKGTALYTSNFTPKRQPLIPESAPNTVLLTCQKGTIRDRSPSAHTITINGDAKSISGASYFYFDGVNDYVTIPASSDYEFGTGDFTIEWWQRIESFVSQYFSIIHANANGANGSQNASIGIRYEGSGASFRVSGNGISTVDFTSLTTSTGVWTHCALVRTGSTLKFFVNTTQVGGDKTFTSNVSTASPSNSTGFIGGAYLGGGSGTLYSNNGKISNLRVYKGKGLTASEVLQNYQNTKSRYGL